MDLLPHEKPIKEYEETISRFKRQNAKSGLLSEGELKKLEERLEALKQKVYGELTSWQRVGISRHPKRPRTTDYFKYLCEEFFELCGDRNFAEDRAIVGGMGRIGGVSFMLIGTEKGHDTDSRVRHNFGMPSPEGYRKALRLMKLAEKFRLPVVTLIDTPGAYCGLGAEERGQGWALAMNLREMASLATPIIVLITGEGCSGGALAVGVGDIIGMLEHSYYSVITPEGCASILWKDADRKEEAAEALKLNSEDLLKLELIDEILPEPLGGAHYNPPAVFAAVKEFLLRHVQHLKTLSTDQLLEKRYQKFRRMGKFLSSTP